MTKEEAIQILDTIPTIGEQVDALEMAIEALEQESCKNAISRRAAQVRIKNICDKYRLSYDDNERKAATGGLAYALGHAFDDLPPVTQQETYANIPFLLHRESGCPLDECVKRESLEDILIFIYELLNLIYDITEVLQDE